MHRTRISVFLIATLLFAAPFAYGDEGELAEEIVTTTVIDCSSLPGTVAITERTRPAARAAGVPDAVSCWMPNNPYMGANVGEAKAYLRSIVCAHSKDNYGGAGPDATIQNLNPNFAVCAAKFLKAASAQMHVCINEGYRTLEKQREYYERYTRGTGGIACNPSATQCEHPRGIAIDVNTVRESDYPRLWNLAPQFGLSFYMRERDKYHFVPANSTCASILSGPDGSTGVSVPTALPVSIYDFPQHAPTANPFQDPNLSFMLPILQQLSQTQQRAPQHPVAIAPTPSVPQISPVSPGPTPSPPTPQISQPPLSVRETPSPTATKATSTSSTPTTSVTIKTGPSWIDIILGYAQDPREDASTGGSVQLNSGLSETSGVPPLSNNPSGSQPQVAANVPFVPRAPQTFISGDLAQNPSPSPFSPAETSRLTSALSQLRMGLERLLGITVEPRTIQNAARWYP